MSTEDHDVIGEQIDTGERDEVHARRALTVKTEARMALPEVSRAADATDWGLPFLGDASHRDGVYRGATMFIEPVRYFATAADFGFMSRFNAMHRYLRVSARVLEDIFSACEMAVRDDPAPGLPLLDVVMMMLDDAPPEATVRAVMDWWGRRVEAVEGPAICHSLHRAREWPPIDEHNRGRFVDCWLAGVGNRNAYPRRAYLDCLKDQARLVSLHALSEEAGMYEAEVEQLRARARARSHLRAMREVSRPAMVPILAVPEVVGSGGEDGEGVAAGMFGRAGRSRLPRPPGMHFLGRAARDG